MQMPNLSLHSCPNNKPNHFNKFKLFIFTLFISWPFYKKLFWVAWHLATHYREKSKIQNASFIEMILVLFGVSMVMKNKSLKSELITDMLVGLNIDSWVHLIQVVLEEVHTIEKHSYFKSAFYFSFEVIS